MVPRIPRFVRKFPGLYEGAHEGSPLKRPLMSMNDTFSVSIKGTLPTLNDTMVARLAYAQSLEGCFGNVRELIACLVAWQEELARGPGNLGNEELVRSRRFFDAHRWAAQQSRHLLSDPTGQEFETSAADGYSRAS